MKLALGTILTLLAFAFAMGSAMAVVPTVIAPNGAATTEGDINNGYPFNRGFRGSQRYQQLYNASQFANVGSGLITQIVFRPDAIGGQAFSSTLADIQIDLSTTSAAEDALSLSFADNIGKNDTIVFARGPLTFSSAVTGPPGGPKDFDIVITLTTPFFYDPGLGNLLLDVRNFGGGVATEFDAVSQVGDGVSRVFSNGSNTVDSPTGVSDSFALVTGFVIVPEPRGVLLLFMGGAILVACSIRRGGQL